MKFLLPLLLILAMTLTAEEVPPKSDTVVVELPRPNSGTFTIAQAEARMGEILENAPTGMLETWKNPFNGYCLHIDLDDRLVLYGHWAKSLDKTYEKPKPIAVGDLKDLPLFVFGNPSGVLITSDKSLKSSKTIHEVLKELFQPSTQLYYVRPLLSAPFVQVQKDGSLLDVPATAVRLKGSPVFVSLTNLSAKGETHWVLSGRIISTNTGTAEQGAVVYAGYGDTLVVIGMANLKGEVLLGISPSVGQDGKDRLPDAIYIGRHISGRAPRADEFLRKYPFQEYK